MIVEHFYVMPIEGCVEPELVGPYLDFDTMLFEAKKLWAEMDSQFNVIFYLYVDDKGKPSVHAFTNVQMDSEDNKGDEYCPSHDEYCPECRVKDHDVCSMTLGCPCCDETIAAQIASWRAATKVT